MEDFDFEMLTLEMEESLENALKNLKGNLAKIKTGRADPTILDGVMFDYYGELSQVSQMASITMPEARQLLIKPYDSTAVEAMVAGIRKAQLSVEPVNEGERIRMTFPMMTTETRKISAKSIGKYKEEAKIAVRNIRKSSMKTVQNSGSPEDEIKFFESEIQKYIVDTNNKVDQICAEKEEQVMKI